MKKPTPEMIELLKQSGSNQFEHATAAQAELAKALTLPLRQGVLNGDIIGGIFEPINFQPGTSIEFPLDFLAPGSEKDFVAYTIPSQGKIPERHVEGDFVMVPTFEVGSSIDFSLRYARDARWDLVGRALQVLEASFVRKMNNDGWHTILAAGVGRGIGVYDAAATDGVFSKRLVALMKTSMRRNGGGNSTSVNRGKLTDLYLSPESMEDCRSWDIGEADDFTRREIFVSQDYGLTKVFGVNLHDIDELGVGQAYNDYYENVLSGTFSDGKLEIAIGLDLEKADSFVMPVRQDIEVFEDPTFHRQRRMGMYGFGEHGFAVLDNRRVLIGQL